MNDLYDAIKGNVAATGGAFAAAVIAMTVWLPKLLNLRKADTIDGTILTRLANAETRMNGMDTIIHNQQIQITRQQVQITQQNGVIIHLVSLINRNGITIPPYLQQEIDDLQEKVEEATGPDSKQGVA